MVGGPRRAARLLVVAVALAYAPIASTAAWSAFVPGAPHLQDLLDRRLAGDRYAAGPGSVSALRDADYADHRVLMLVHTVLGAACLLLAVRQMLGPARWHRVVGVAHVAVVTVSMVAAMLFLVASAPGPGPGQEAFRAQLWVLALSTLGTAWLAALEAVRGHTGAHRAWMTLHIAFLLTAPVLRLTWTLLAPLFPGRDMLTNIESGAVLLAVVAPAGGVIAALLPAGGAAGRAEIGRCAASRRCVLGAALLGSVGLACVVAAASAPVEGHVLFHVVPSLALLLGCSGAALRGRGTGGSGVSPDAVVLLRAAATVPWAVLAAAVPAALAGGWSAGLLTGLMVAPGFPLVAALSCLLARRAAPDGGSPHRPPDNLMRGDVVAGSAA
ncbi:hypothetical protein [Nocardioides daeguensis]|uniref:DUF2306 domain-containing protein n=1 Tax=Nocardioides daeguensis TaxID=908359 RepID=A0ABP6V0M0_9ACTN|nr:hypothetical protein [Nocardioides daeguensis]MBV6728768.1 hypothetical protein [Nocardioides daeguensis]MCR1773622.1 hypothetical protein [Nocardioides daeguensis]